MKDRNNHSCLGFDNLPLIGVPETPAEFDQLAGPTKDGGSACLAGAIADTVYRGWNAEFRSTFQEKLEATSNFPRLVKKQGPANKAGETKPIYESEAEYLNRYIASQVNDAPEKGPVKTREAVIADLQPLAVEVAKSLKFDPKPSERKSNGIGKEWYAAADQILEVAKTHPKGAEAVFNHVKAKFDRENPGQTMALSEDGTVTREELARTSKINAERVARESANAQLAGLDEE